jgi:hypothetical protein
MKSYYETVTRIRSHEGRTACIFRAGKAETGRDGLYAGLQHALSARMDVEFVDEDFLSSYEAMFRSPVDILVIPELETVPERSFRNIKQYLARGGALLVSSDDLFMGKLDESYLPIFETKKHYEDEYFRRTSAYLGLKPYTAEVEPRDAIVDTDFLPRLDPHLEAGLPARGVTCATGSDVLHPEPPYGHAFPERYLVSRNYVVVKGADPLGAFLTSSVVFNQNWEQGSRTVVVASNEQGGMLEPSKEWFEPLLESAVDFCLNQVMITALEPDYACYRRGEKASIGYRIRNFGDCPVNCELTVRLSAEGQSLKDRVEEIEVPARGTIEGSVADFDLSGSADYYAVDARITANGRVLSKADNAFVVWDDTAAATGPRLSASEKYFSIDGKPALIAGTNYYESNLGELMWLHPDIGKLDADLRQMAESGIRYLRIHYHHPKWFHDYLLDAHGSLPRYFEGRYEALPEERFLRIFDAHVYLCQKHGIVYGGDLFTLLPEELGDPRGWYGVHDYAWFPEKKSWQRRFLELLIPRYLKVPGIAWDLYNEPKGVNEQAFLNWAKEMKGIVRNLGDDHPITVGTARPERYDAAVDFFAEHRNFTEAGGIRISTPKPEMLQEAWLDRPSTEEGNAAQREDMCRALLGTFGSGLGGFSPWQWTNQARLWNDYRSYIGEIWDDRLGCCVRDDGTMKPAGAFFRDFAHLVGDLPVEGFDGKGFHVGRKILEFRQMKDGPAAPGELLIAFRDADRLYRGLAIGVLDWKGEVLVESERGGYLWFLTPDLGGITRDANLFLKVSEAGTLTLIRNRPVEKATLCGTLEDAAGGRPIPVENEDGRTVIRIEDWHRNYWIHVQ